VSLLILHATVEQPFFIVIPLCLVDDSRINLGGDGSKKTQIVGLWDRIVISCINAHTVK
jgi:hypothetical protein